MCALKWQLVNVKLILMYLLQTYYLYGLQHIATAAQNIISQKDVQCWTNLGIYIYFRFDAY